MNTKVFMQGISLIETISRATKGQNFRGFSERELEVYRTLLDDIPEELFVKGVTELLKSRPYANLPSPAEIREFCLEMKEDQLQVRILTAKNKLKQAISSVGTYSSVAFDDPILHLIIRDCGGWCQLGRMQNDALENFLKWDFPKSYKAYVGRKNTEIPTHFLGIERNEKEIVYVGNEEQAKKWILAYENKKQIGYAEKLQERTVNNLLLEGGKIGH